MDFDNDSWLLNKSDLSIRIICLSLSTLTVHAPLYGLTKVFPETKYFT
jgi:hypothetical protein